MTANWGSRLWYLLHTLSSSYPEHPTKLTQKYYSIFINQLYYIIPCPRCQKECILYMKKHPPELQNRDSLFHWLYRFHNSVNIRLGKSTITIEDCKNRYASTNHAKNIETIDVLTGYHFHDIYKIKHYLNWLQLLCSFYPNFEYRTQLCNMYIKFYNHAVKIIKKKYIGMMPGKYKMRLMGRKK